MKRTLCLSSPQGAPNHVICLGLFCCSVKYGPGGWCLLCVPDTHLPTAAWCSKPSKSDMQLWFACSIHSCGHEAHSFKPMPPTALNARPQPGTMLSHVPSASPWQANTAFEECQPTPEAPMQAPANHWRGNAIFQTHLAAAMAAAGPRGKAVFETHLEAAMAAAGPDQPAAWSQNPSFQPASDPFKLPVDHGSSHIDPSWLGNGAFAPDAQPESIPEPGNIPQEGRFTGNEQGGNDEGANAAAAGRKPKYWAENRPAGWWCL